MGMHYLLTGLAILAVLLLAMKWFVSATPQASFRAGVFVAGIAFMVLAGYLAVTGKLAAALPAVIAALIAYRKNQQLKGAGAGNSYTGQGASGGQMGRDEAYKVLGLEPGASRDEVHASYKKLMQKLHPDKEGTEYLAQKINQARDTLLDKKSP